MKHIKTYENYKNSPEYKKTMKDHRDRWRNYRYQFQDERISQEIVELFSREFGNNIVINPDPELDNIILCLQPSLPKNKEGKTIIEKYPFIEVENVTETINGDKYDYFKLFPIYSKIAFQRFIGDNFPELLPILEEVLNSNQYKIKKQIYHEYGEYFQGAKLGLL